MRGKSLLWVCLVGSLGCRGAAGSVQSLTVDLAISPAALDFGSVYLEASANQSVTIENQGTAAESATVTLSTGPFSAVGGPTFALPPGATTSIPIAFKPSNATEAQATAHVAWDEGSADVALSGSGVAWPDCTPSAQCEVATFDPQAGICRSSQLADGAGCDGGASSCLADARCQAGQCVGEPIDCNDGNACTQDSCVEGQGCVHQEEGASCSGTDPCQVYACDPSKGCTSSNAPDGTLCSNDESCQTADICILGKCIGTPVPDGFPCVLWWAPCATDAECQHGTCDSPTADLEKPGDVRWSWQPDGGDLPAAIDVPAVDELGNSYVCGSNQTGGWASGEMDLASLDQCGLLRWQNPDYKGVTSLLLAGQELVFVDPATSDIVALYRDTGQPLWDVSLLPNLVSGPPDGCNQVQVSALALSPLGPIYAAGTVSNLCGLTGEVVPFLASLLPNGSVVWAQTVSQPNSSSFGLNLMVDRQGNSYLYEVLPTMVFGPDAEPFVASYDTQGQLRFFAPLTTSSPVFGLGTDRVVEATQGQTWDLDGGFLGTLDGGLNLAPSASVTVDSQDNVYVFGGNGPGGNGSWLVTLAAFQGTTPRWTDSLPLSAGSSDLVLGPDQLFLAMADACGGCPGLPAAQIASYASATGTELWFQALPPLPYPYPPATLTLSNTATLILAAGGQVTAFFAGQEAPPDNAPWSRAGGSYSNQSSSAPPVQPTLPSSPAP